VCPGFTLIPGALAWVHNALFVIPAWGKRSRRVLAAWGQPPVAQPRRMSSSGAERRFRRLNAPHLLAKVYAGVRYVDGVEATQEVAA